MSTTHTKTKGSLLEVYRSDIALIEEEIKGVFRVIKSRQPLDYKFLTTSQVTELLNSDKDVSVSKSNGVVAITNFEL